MGIGHCRNIPFCSGPQPGLTSGTTAAGAAPGIMPPIGMSPTSWIFNVFCRARGEQFQKWAVTPHTLRDKSGMVLTCRGHTFHNLLNYPNTPETRQGLQTSVPRPSQWYLQELIEV